jgi:hypothetical protein
MPVKPFWRADPAAGAAPGTTGTAAPAGAAGLIARVPAPVRLLVVMLGLLALWYGVIGTIRAGIHVDLATRPERADLPPGGSVTAGMAARLLSQQVADRAFTPNDPIFYPTGLARRTPAFQEALVRTIGTAVEAMATDSRAPRLTAAADALATDPTLWWIRAEMPPVGRAAESHLLRGRTELRAYNMETAAARRAATQAAKPRQISSRGAAVLGALLQAIEDEAERGDRLIRDPSAGSSAVQLARARGTAYAAALLLRGVREDEAAAIRLSGRAGRWSEAQDALDRAAMLDPVFVGEGDLVGSGYALLVAATSLRAILAGQG